MWISSLNNEDVKLELRGLLYPVFCHLYLEMLHAGNPQAAIQFLKAHQSEFPSDSERDFLEELSSVFSIQDIELRPLVNAFRTRKYKVDVSDEAHIALQKYLAKQGHVIIMQVKQLVDKRKIIFINYFGIYFMFLFLYWLDYKYPYNYN